MGKTLDEIKNEYIGQSVDVDTSEPINPFRGWVANVRLDTDGTILIVVIDGNNDAFDIPIDDVQLVE